MRFLQKTLKKTTAAARPRKRIVLDEDDETHWPLLASCFKKNSVLNFDQKHPGNNYMAEFYRENGITVKKESGLS